MNKTNKTNTDNTFQQGLEGTGAGDQGEWSCNCETGDCLIQFAAFGRLIYG